VHGLHRAGCQRPIAAVASCRQIQAYCSDFATVQHLDQTKCRLSAAGILEKTRNSLFSATSDRVSIITQATESERMPIYVDNCSDASAESNDASNLDNPVFTASNVHMKSASATAPSRIAAQASFAYLNDLSAQLIPDTRSAGDFCRRFAAEDVHTLIDSANDVRKGVWLPPAGAAGRFGYVGSLDGFRAVAVAMVMGWHSMGPVSGAVAHTFEGWLGVSAFFVLSGFLITSLLLQERADQGGFDLKKFYVRRCLRIWPAYYTLILAVVLLRPAENPPSAARFPLVFLTNYAIIFRWGDIGHDLRHLWSVAVEEQFYLLWPLALRLSGKRALPFTAITLCVAGIWRTTLLRSGGGEFWLMRGLDTRLDELLLGCLAAIVWASPHWRARLGAWLGGGWTPLVLVGALGVVSSSHYRSILAGKQLDIWAWVVRPPLFAGLIALLILALVANPTSPLARGLARPLPVWLGRLSYSLYLWHLLAFAAWDGTVCRWLPSWLAGYALLGECGRLAMSLLLATACYYFVERPFLNWKKSWQSLAAQGRASTSEP
jgi:peptidoglycan/LPS O-acetylase OafA/YrhL